eukprot:8834320-Ditylum_brightwellii.AAC.1
MKATIASSLTLFLQLLLLLSPPRRAHNQCHQKQQKGTFVTVQAIDSPSFVFSRNHEEGNDGLCIQPPYVPPVKSEIERQRRLVIDELLSTFWNPTSGFRTKDGEAEEIDEFLADSYGGKVRDTVAAKSEGGNEREKISNDEGEWESGSKPSTYGEVTTIGGRQLFDVMGLYNVGDDDNGSRNGGGRVFYDLGSGTGKLVAHAAMEIIPMSSSSSYGLKKSSGIELSNSRHEMAISSWSNLVNSLYIELATTTTLSDTTKEEDDDPLLMIRTKKLNAVFVH